MPVPDDYSPVMQGDTHRPFAPAFTTLDATGKVIPYNLTGLTISMKMKNGAGVVKTCAGSWTVVDAANGLAQYHYQASDVDTPGVWTKYIEFTDTNNEVQHATRKLLEIDPLP